MNLFDEPGDVICYWEKLLRIAINREDISIYCGVRAKGKDRLPYESLDTENCIFYRLSGLYKNGWTISLNLLNKFFEENVNY